MLGSPEGESIGLPAQGVQVSGYDIWSGGTRSEILPRAREGDVEKLLGKRGTFADRNANWLQKICRASWTTCGDV